ncbi:F-box domain-containing protein [Mycena sanguinolenta]|uniref:F-box domain-containing protein n=1 Tax=Mycena sanguinolenta TaxID=230812 RepID=A0A8H6YEB6_9AGAR|nr:F-box domain-containing protein [Mycena sanguinolenta]
MNPLPSTPTFESQVKILIKASEDNIARIESQIRDLECLRDRERGNIARLRMAIAPVSKLPVELLADIFRRVCATNPFTLSMLRDRKRQIQKVQALSQVCAYWRRVAHATPQLWTDQLITTVDKTPTVAYISCVKDWTADGRNGHDSSSMEESGFGPPFAFSTFSDPPDSLKCLVSGSLRSADATKLERTKLFATAERLRRISLATGHTSKLLMPWSQLTDLNVRDSSPRECLGTLVQCPHIVNAVFKTGAWKRPPDLSQRPITTLARLKKLVVSFHCTIDGFTTPFFDRLALPALKVLTLDLRLEQTWSSAEFTQFQLRSPDIEQLELNREPDDTWAEGPITPSDMLALLRHAPQLVKLSVDHCMGSFDDSVISALRYSPTHATHLVPKLEDLSLEFITAEDFDEDILDATIQSRWWTAEQLGTLPAPPKVARWSDIFIHYGDDDDDNVSSQFRAKLEEYRSQGLEIGVW